MGVNLIVAVTDSRWFEILRNQRDLAEVNFWAPGAANFKALQQGELFLFKLHAPRNVIVGGGVFAHASTMPCSLAWQAFGVANGAESAAEMRSRIARYRKVDPADRSDFMIGCRVLTDPFFLDEKDWIPAPPSWSPNIVTFKTYDTETSEGMQLWEAMSAHLSRAPTRGFGEGPRYGQPRLIEPRLGQGAFRMVVTDLYQRRCAVTDEKTLPALEAAHIRPYADGGPHEIANGLLLRRDIHSLFDAGYVTVTPQLHFEVSRRIKEEFDNGKHYYALHGKKIAAPLNLRHHPSISALRWHNEERFKT